MTLMLRALVLATLFVVVPRAAAVQALSVLHIKVVLVEAEGKATPVPRHALLVSDNPTSAPPRRIVTALDGTADVRLRPGNYTVESDRPVAHVARDLGIHKEALRQWVRQAEADQGRRPKLLTTNERDELKRLRKEVVELRRANAILKDASVYFATELDPTRRR